MITTNRLVSGAAATALLLGTACSTPDGNSPNSIQNNGEPPPLTLRDKRNLAQAFRDHDSIPRGQNCSLSTRSFETPFASSAVRAIGGTGVVINAAILAGANPGPEQYTSTVNSLGIASSTGGDAHSLKAWRKGDQGPEGFAIDTPNQTISAVISFADGKNGDAVLVDIGDGFNSYALGVPDSRGVRSVSLQSDGENFINGITVYANEASVGLVGVTGQTLTVQCQNEGGPFTRTPDLPPPTTPVTPPQGGCIGSCGGRPSVGTGDDRDGNDNNNRDRSTGVETTGGNDPADSNPDRGSVGADRDRGSRGSSPSNDSGASSNDQGGQDNGGRDNGGRDAGGNNDNGRDSGTGNDSTGGNDPSSGGGRRGALLLEQFNGTPLAEEHEFVVANDAEGNATFYTYATPEVA